MKNDQATPDECAQCPDAVICSIDLHAGTVLQKSEQCLRVPLRTRAYPWTDALKLC